MVRVDWIPARGQTIRIGVAAPLFQPLAGRTRPRETTVRIPDPPQPSVHVVATRDAAARQLVRDIESASSAIADVTLKPIRFVCRPDVTAFEGTEPI